MDDLEGEKNVGSVVPVCTDPAQTSSVTSR